MLQLWSYKLSGIRTTNKIEFADEFETVHKIDLHIE